LWSAGGGGGGVPKPRPVSLITHTRPVQKFAIRFFI
jgi:hypothetical protein